MNDTQMLERLTSAYADLEAPAASAALTAVLDAGGIVEDDTRDTAAVVIPFACPRSKVRMRYLVAAMVASFVALSGLAGAGALPGPLQRGVSSVVSHLGLDLPNPQPGHGGGDGPGSSHNGGSGSGGNGGGVGGSSTSTSSPGTNGAGKGNSSTGTTVPRGTAATTPAGQPGVATTPTTVVPGIDGVPPITVPPVTLPPVTVPQLTLPPISLPPISVPPITLLPQLPPIVIPPIQLPPITLPPILGL